MSDLQQTLAELHRELTRAGQLAPEERALLESTIRDIREALERSRIDAVEADAEPRERDAGVPGEALEGAAVRLEAEHPGVAGAVRALLDALAKAGI